MGSPWVSLPPTLPMKLPMTGSISISISISSFAAVDVDCGGYLRTGRALPEQAYIKSLHLHDSPREVQRVLQASLQQWCVDQAAALQEHTKRRQCHLVTEALCNSNGARLRALVRELFAALGIPRLP